MNLLEVEYRVRVRVPNGTRYTLDQMVVDSCNLEENDGEVAARVTFSVRNEKLEDGWLHKHLYVGNYVYIHARVGGPWQEVFRGRVYDWRNSQSSQAVEVICYDLNYRYQVSEVNIYRRKNETAANLTKRLIARWKDRVIKQLDGPFENLPAKAYDSKMTVTEIIEDSIQESKDKDFVIHCIEGEIGIVKKGTNETIYVLGDFLEDLSDDHSIRNLVTRVRIYKRNNHEDPAKLAETIDGETKYGVLQRLVYTDGMTMSEARKEANQILKDEGKVVKNRKIKHPDIPFIKKGDKIRAFGGSVGSKNKPADMIVKNINHDIKNLSMTINTE